MGKDLNNAMDSTEGNNQYDEACKKDTWKQRGFIPYSD